MAQGSYFFRFLYKLDWLLYGLPPWTYPPSSCKLSSLIGAHSVLPPLTFAIYPKLQSMSPWLVF